MKKLILIVGLSLISFGALRAELEISGAERVIEQTLYSGEMASLDGVMPEIAAALAAAPDSGALNYLNGFAAYARTTAGYVSKDMKAVRANLEEADGLLKKVKGQPWAAEAQALRVLIAGQLIGVRGGASMMTLGPKMRELTSAAYEQVPASGRVLICHGVTLLNTPEMFGGDVAEAKRLFGRAVAAFDAAEAKDAGEKSGATRAAAVGPAWGRANALCWLAQACLKTGDVAGARAAAEQALKLEPGYRQVRFRLLREIEKREAKK